MLELDNSNTILIGGEKMNKCKRLSILYWKALNFFGERKMKKNLPTQDSKKAHGTNKKYLELCKKWCTIININ